MADRRGDEVAVDGLVEGGAERQPEADASTTSRAPQRVDHAGVDRHDEQDLRERRVRPGGGAVDAAPSRQTCTPSRSVSGREALRAELEEPGDQRRRPVSR